MLPYDLKVAWLVLCLSGVIITWIVLYAFMKAMGVYWAPTVYAIGNTGLNLVVALGVCPLVSHLCYLANLVEKV